MAEHKRRLDLLIDMIHFDNVYVYTFTNIDFYFDSEATVRRCIRPGHGFHLKRHHQHRLLL